MNRNKIKKVMAIALGVSIMSSLAVVGCANSEPEYTENAVTPRYIAIAETTTGIKWLSSGKVECSAATEVWDGYAAGLTAELQMYDGGWTTIATWTDSDWDYASIYATYYVDSDYDYRLKTTHYSYDSNWNQLESTVLYSDTI